MNVVTQRLVLRDFAEADLPALHAYRSDVRYQEFYEPADHSLERTRRFIASLIEEQAEVPRRNFQLAVVEPSVSDDVIGCCCVRCKGFEEGVGEFGLEFAPRVWGRGLATEAARAMGRFAFGELGLRTVVAESVTQNIGVNRLATRLGLEPHRTRVGPDWMRPAGWSQSEWRITAEDWADTNVPG